jgi:hypothetical protein
MSNPLPEAAAARHGSESPRAASALSRYADWLAGLSWKRFILLAVLTLMAAGILSEVPPFDLPWGEDRHVVRTPDEREVSISERDHEVQIDSSGVRIVRRAPAASAPGASGAVLPKPPEPIVDIPLPPGAVSEDVREAIEEAKAELREALREARQPRVEVIEAFRLGDVLPQLMLLLILASIIAKVGAGRRKAEARAAEATEIAEGEALKRQVVEARMAAMQAQVEPHFLFNTLASIDHLIETDARRASAMLQQLIALLRSSMPTMRETAADGAPRDLARELAVVRPYLEILKMRMEERLQVTIDVPDGLLSAEFPPMMMQSLVENALKHGLEPKPEGGALTVKAEIVHGKLRLTVADTGLGFGKGNTAGTGVGLANVRERLQLLYGSKAALTIAENQPSGTVVTITVPYVAHARDDAA